MLVTVYRRPVYNRLLSPSDQSGMPADAVGTSFGLTAWRWTGLQRCGCAGSLNSSRTGWHWLSGASQSVRSAYPDSAGISADCLSLPYCCAAAADAAAAVSSSRNSLLIADYPSLIRSCCITLEHFSFETLRVSNHTACRFAGKARFPRSLLAGRHCPAASRFAFFNGNTL